MLAFARTDTSVFNGVISGTGTVSQIGAGTTVLTAANSYGGGTIISGGTLQIGNGGTTGSVTGNIADDGTLGFNRSDATSFGGNISGTGGVSLIGTGVLTLTGVESYTGATSIAGVSTLVVASGASIATSSDVIDNGVLDMTASPAPQLASLGGLGSVLIGAQTLAFTNGADAFAGNVAGSGGLTVNGGAQILSGTNSYTGATVVNGGTLTVNGAITGSSGVTVNSGGTLGGSGATKGYREQRRHPGAGRRHDHQWRPYHGRRQQLPGHPDQHLGLQADGERRCRPGRHLVGEQWRRQLALRPETDRADRRQRRQRHLHGGADRLNRRAICPDREL